MSEAFYQPFEELNMLTNLILRWTHRIWNRQISRILCRAYEERIINSRQMHLLSAAFDPTQRHIVYGERAVGGFRWGVNGGKELEQVAGQKG